MIRSILTISTVAIMAAVSPAQAQQEEILRLGIGLIGQAIQQSQQPQRPAATVAAPVAPVAPAYVDIPVPRPRPDFRMAEVAAIQEPAAVQVDSVMVDHNGSTMEIVVVDQLVTITYAQPRQGLAQAGVTPGTLLFKGAVVDGRLVGDAFAFKSACEAAAYPVSGQIEATGNLVLEGPGPVRSGCSVARLDPDSPHSRLAFTGQGTELVALLTPAPVELEIVIAEPAPIPVLETQPVPVAAAPAPVEIDQPAPAVPAPMLPPVQPAAQPVAPVPAPAVVAAPKPTLSPAPLPVQPVAVPVVTPPSATVAPPPPPAKPKLDIAF